MGVRTNFLALIGQKVFAIVGKRFYIFNKPSVQITIIIGGVFLLLTIMLPLFFGFLDILELNRGDTTKIMSKMIILPDLYRDALSYLPMDYRIYLDSNKYQVGLGLERANELTLIAIFVMSGAPIALIFLFCIIKLTPSYRVFILLSLLHYSAIVNPLIIYLVFMFENNIRQIKEK